MRSDEIKSGPSRAPARAMWKAVGLSDEAISRPLIGIANTWTEITPCNAHLRELAEQVKIGVREAGGTPLEFNTIVVTDGIAMGSSGMRASLVSREVVADSIELVARGHLLDGVVAISGCDKTIPGTVMALARLDLPSLMLYGGSIAPGRFRGKDVTIQDVFEAVGAHAAGKMSDEDLHELEGAACPGAGACGGQFTANTMSVATAFLGISPMVGNEVPATDPRKPQVARRVGRRVMELLREGRTAREFLSREALRNAYVSVSATAGSTNAVLHLLAIAHEAGSELTLEDLDEIGATTPVLTDLKPGGRFTAPDMETAGGMRLPGQPAPRTRATDRHPHGLGRFALRTGRSRRRTRGPGGHPARRTARQGAGRARHPHRQPGARGMRPEARRTYEDTPRRPGAGLRLGGGRLRGGPGRPHPAGRRDRDPLRGSAGRPRNARDARRHRGGHRARPRGTAWRSSPTAASAAPPTAS